MSALPGNSVVFDFIARSTALSKSLRDVENRVQQTADKVAKTKVVVPVTLDKPRLERDAKQVEQTVKRVQEKVTASTNAIAKAQRQTATGGGGGFSSMRFDAKSFGLTPINQLAAFAKGGGPLVAAALAVTALSDAFGQLSERIDKGTDSFGAFVGDFLRAIPIFGRIGTLADNINKVNEAMLLREAGLIPSEQANQLDPFSKFVIEQRGLSESVEAEFRKREEEQARRNELEGKKGFELDRAVAKQRADLRSEELAILQEEASKLEGHADQRAEAMGRIIDLQLEIAEDYRQQLREIDAAEAVERMQAAAREWFDDLTAKLQKRAQEQAAGAAGAAAANVAEGILTAATSGAATATINRAVGQLPAARSVGGFEGLQNMHRSLQLAALSTPAVSAEKENTEATKANTAAAIALAATMKEKQQEVAIVGP